MLITILSVKLPVLFLLYTDPGSGALLLQILFAGLLGGVFYLRRFKEKVFRLLGTKKNRFGKLPEKVS
jgi:hypothetical protein